MSWLGQVNGLLPSTHVRTLIFLSWTSPSPVDSATHQTHCHLIILSPARPSLYSKLHLPWSCSHSGCAVGLSQWMPRSSLWGGGASQASEEKLFGLGQLGHYLIKADDKRLFCFGKVRLKKLNMRKGSKQKLNKQKPEKLAPSIVPCNWPWLTFKKSFWMNKARETYYKILLPRSLLSLTTFYYFVEHSHLGLNGNVWEDNLEIQDLNLFRVSPKYSCLGTLKKFAGKKGR